MGSAIDRRARDVPDPRTIPRRVYASPELIPAGVCGAPDPPPGKDAPPRHASARWYFAFWSDLGAKIASCRVVAAYALHPSSVCTILPLPACALPPAPAFVPAATGSGRRTTRPAARCHRRLLLYLPQPQKTKQLRVCESAPFGNSVSRFTPHAPADPCRRERGRHGPRASPRTSCRAGEIRNPP